MPPQLPRQSTLYCVNPWCRDRQNSWDADTCQSCGTPLLIRNRYRAIAPLRSLERRSPTQLFRVQDLGAAVAQVSPYKVLKTLKGKTDSVALQLFQQEATVLAQLDHPRLPKVAVEDGYFTLPVANRRQPLHCLVMEEVEGDNLETWIDHNGPISDAVAQDWLLQLLDVLGYLHQHQYIHRDVKPSNIMRRPDGQLVLIDCGTLSPITHTLLISIGRRLQDPGVGVVSPGYTAPEQLKGRAVPQSDLFALGRTFVYLLTGQNPCLLGGTDERIQATWRQQTPPLSDLTTVWLNRLIEPLPWQRPPNALFVVERLIDGEGPPPRREPVPTWLVLINLVLFGTLVITAYLWIQAHQANQPLRLSSFLLSDHLATVTSALFAYCSVV